MSGCITHAFAQDLVVHVDKKGKVGFVDRSGNEVVKCVYDNAFPFKDGHAIVSKGGKSGIIDATGKVTLPLKYVSIMPWSHNIYVISSGKSVGLADHAGNIILKPSYTFITRPNSYGKSMVKAGNKFGLIDSTGTVLIAPAYKYLREFSALGKDFVQYHEGYRDGKEIEATDTLSTDCAYMLFSRKANESFGLLDGKGNILIEPQNLGFYMMRPSNGMVRTYRVVGSTCELGYCNLATGKMFTVTTINKKLSDIDF